MPPTPHNRTSWLSYGYLAPFAVLAVYALAVLWGLATGNLFLAQPRSYDAPLPANACACLVLIGLAPFALAAGWKRTGMIMALGAAGLGLATLIEGPLDVNLHIDNLLINHEALISGQHIGRMPAVLATLFMLAGLLQLWQAMRPGDRRRTVLLALLGSLVGAYGLTGLLGYRIGLNDVEAWQYYARLGPHTSILLIVSWVVLLV